MNDIQNTEMINSKCEMQFIIKNNLKLHHKGMEYVFTIFNQLGCNCDSFVNMRIRNDNNIKQEMINIQNNINTIIRIKYIYINKK
ncbi:hypothetical protein EDI_015980 [Entamoeba dispar SAW760]|uniref:Uncharacterized protein n=1 Tax=Entamoeba dispar (strain ATCC PRA-260 / SAW760) TaxID=370354 RepID=B0EKJ9_ENTDS|nr:uncharacterized protein EDI_015980 [Entamoeba dispar SAW760]EDR24950.1 hypothetical protein EDI_015980 [Entamoeba dispar SAW760]|eukprot:EDR24950.1 hypothetical protein EDI_015980 [Entamoeba dispar SAW760]